MSRDKLKTTKKLKQIKLTFTDMPCMVEHVSDYISLYFYDLPHRHLSLCVSGIHCDSLSFWKRSDIYKEICKRIKNTSATKLEFRDCRFEQGVIKDFLQFASSNSNIATWCFIDCQIHFRSYPPALRIDYYEDGFDGYLDMSQREGFSLIMLSVKKNKNLIIQLGLSSGSYAITFNGHMRHIYFEGNGGYDIWYTFPHVSFDFITATNCHIPHNLNLPKEVKVIKLINISLNIHFNVLHYTHFIFNLLM